MEKIHLEKVKSHRLFTFFSTIKRRGRNFHALACSDGKLEMYRKNVLHVQRCCSALKPVKEFLSSWLFPIIDYY